MVRTSVKFLCSYGGRIFPRYPDGKLRYLGGETRVLAVDRFISFAGLMLKLKELCGTTMVILRCQLPTEDLDALVSITSDEDIANLIEEYDRASSPQSILKIRAFLSLQKKVSPAPLPSSDSSSKSSSSSSSTPTPPKLSMPASNRCVRQFSTQAGFHLCSDRSTGKIPYQAHGNPSQNYLVHDGNHWQ